jgi:hypothetical protein
MSSQDTSATGVATGATSWKSEYQIDVADHPAAGLWLRETAKRDPDGFMRLIGPNEQALARIFGKPEWSNDGSKGWTHGWSLYENNMNWLILTGDRGTYFRLRVPVPGDAWLADAKVGAGIVQYLGQLLRRLSE